MSKLNKWSGFKEKEEVLRNGDKAYDHYARVFNSTLPFFIVKYKTMLSQNLKLIYQEFFPLYRSRLKSFNTNNLKKLIKLIIVKSAKEAFLHYKKLNFPKTCSLDTYTYIWVRQVLERDLASRTVRKISLQNPPPAFKFSAEYFSFFPSKKHEEIRNKFFAVSPEKRREIWESFKLPFEEIEKRFIRMVLERNDFARSNSFSSYLEMMLSKYKIPFSSYNRFIQNKEKIIKFCNQQLSDVKNTPLWFYSEFNRPCFLCLLEFFPFKTFEEIINYYAKKYPMVNKFKEKIKIFLERDSKLIYERETDSFQIILDKSLNTRHQMMDLIHELSHLVYKLKVFRKGVESLKNNGRYLQEKEALKIEFSTLKDFSSSPLFKALLGEVLLTYHTVLFEIELYKNPQQNLSRLYAEIFNRCFKKGKQENNPFFILDKHIVFSPFFLLPYAVAYSEVIGEFMNR